jgi:hypothetical protein
MLSTLRIKNRYQAEKDLERFFLSRNKNTPLFEKAKAMETNFEF